MLQYYVIERFLYRLSQTDWSSRLIVKGAIMLRAWGTPLGRPTRDIDFLGMLDGTPDGVAAAIRECLAIECPEDGLEFDRDVTTTVIKIADRYPGVRVVLRGRLAKGEFQIQIDVGIDDAVTPDPAWVEFPTLIGHDAPVVLAYQPATAIAEKFETIVTRGLTSSRMKDYYDLWLLLSTRDHKGRHVSDAIAATFNHRDVVIPTDIPPGLTSAFLSEGNRQQYWVGFLTKKQPIDAPHDLAVVCEEIAGFLMPPARAAATGEPFESIWRPGKGWTSSSAESVD